jgi:regulator of protease activity HflC (stomatin/prohibitin superfamily)
MTVTYKAVNPEQAENSAESYYDMLYASAQLALRTAVSRKSIEEILDKRGEISREVQEEIAEEAESIGLKVQLAEIKDVMFSGELKRIMNEVIKAKKEGQAALEKARGESAALRNLANAAKMLEGNPGLLNLRVLQAIANASNASGNTFVMGVSQGLIPVAAGQKENSNGKAK